MKGYKIILIAILCTIFQITIAEEDPCDLVPDGTFIADSESCDGWIRCNNGKSSKGKCPEGLRFKASAGACDIKDNVPCMDDLCTEENEGEFFADERSPRRCPAYILCYEGVAEFYDCPDGLFFDKDRKVCDYKEKVKCENEENVPNSLCMNIPDKTLLRNKDDCSKYFECKDHKANEGTCEGTQLYNQRIGKCDDNKNVECEISCAFADEGKTKKNPKSCRSFYQCKNQKPNEIKCKNNELVNVVGEEGKSQFTCDDQMNVSNEVCPNRCENRSGVGFVPAYSDKADERCKRYHPCKNGEINGGNTVFECPVDKYLNDDRQSCVVANNIDRKTCRNISK